jgi:xylulokinase
MIYLGIDCGTQGTKAILYDSEKKQILSKGYATHQLISDDTGLREQKAQWWTEALELAVQQALVKANIKGSEVKALSVSGQQHGLVVLDGQGKVLRNVKLWNDTSTASYNERLLDELGGLGKGWKLLGTTLPVGYTASKLLYLIDREPEIFSKTEHVLLPHDYLNFFLTGRYATDSSEASGTGYYDVKNREYSSQMMKLIDSSNRLSSLVPAVVGWENPIGVILPEIADRLGLSRDVLVAAGGGDNSMGAIGTTSIVQGRSTLSLGTSGTVCIATNKMSDHIDPLLQMYDILQDQWLATCCTLNATSATTTLQKLFGLSLKELDGAMEKSPIGAEGLVSIPFYDGERMPPLPQARGLFKNLSSLNFTRENMIRATAESVIFTLKWGYDKIQEAFGGDYELVLTGGGSNSAPWRKIIANVFALPVHCLSIDEGGALGAALQAQYMYEKWKGFSNQSLAEISKGCMSYDERMEVTPDTGATREYEQHYAKYKETIEKEWGIIL